MHDDTYPFLMDENLSQFDLYMREYIKRLEYARFNGCNTLMLTGSSEPQQNRKFLTFFGMFMQLMKNPFHCIEMQTTGVGIDRDYLRFLKSHVGVSLISLSVFALEDDLNVGIINPPKGMEHSVLDLACDIKDFDFSLRMSLNLTKYFDRFATHPADLFDNLKRVYEADQVTLRVLYESGKGCPEDEWVRNNSASPETVAILKSYIIDNGRLLGVLPYGARKYSVHGMSVVIDDDSMGKDSQKRETQPDTYKYLILRPNCRLYSEWDDPGSLIF